MHCGAVQIFAAQAQAQGQITADAVVKQGLVKFKTLNSSLTIWTCYKNSEVCTNGSRIALRDQIQIPLQSLTRISLHVHSELEHHENVRK
jgi:hypothetical protein